ncbi:hypothetical protein [Agrobacterium pusense]|uniref:hypothetical protein n=1 Tax=Agrobacterium pusense TaxID=648995 RepID=UPI0024536D20|nr:hypothetical protein [Agrobacterium pusense]
MTNIEEQLENLAFGVGHVQRWRGYVHSCASGNGAASRPPKAGVMLECADGSPKPAVLTCDVASDLICLEQTKGTGFIFRSDETKCCIAALMVVVGGDVNRDVFH